MAGFGYFLMGVDPLQVAFMLDLKGVLVTLRPALEHYRETGEDFMLIVNFGRGEMEGKEAFFTVITLDEYTHFCAPMFADQESAKNFGEAIVNAIMSIAGETMGLELKAAFDQNQFN